MLDFEEETAAEGEEAKAALPAAENAPAKAAPKHQQKQAHLSLRQKHILFKSRQCARQG